jgi:protein gp37
MLMGAGSKIEWTEVTWNPVTGCDRVSAGCDNCYALTLAKRLKAMGVNKYQADGNAVTSGPGFGVTTHPHVLDAPKSWRAPRTVFVNSMSDLFHAKVPFEFIEQVFSVMADTPRHTYQVLTKRPARVKKLADRLVWPDNVWLGASVEDQATLHRISDLAQVPAKVKFLSCEPLLGPLPDLPLSEIGWVIVGGESGIGARPVDRAWVTDIRDQCVEARIPFFFKQWGGRTPKLNGRELDGRLWNEMPSKIPGAFPTSL